MQSLAKQLHSEDVEVRAAAGEAIALLYHSCGISDLDAFLENDKLDESPPASPVRQSRQSQSQLQSQSPVSTSPLSGQKPQHLGSLDSLPPQGQAIDPQGGAADAASLASSASASITSPQQVHVREGSQSACARSAEADSEPQARPVTHHSSESQAAELPQSHAHEEEHSLFQEPDEAQVQMAAQRHSHDAQHAQQHSNGMNHGDHHLQHNEEVASDTAEANGNLDSSSPLLAARNQDAGAEDMSSRQEQGMGKSRQAANPKSTSQNPQQKAEAISNGLDDVVGRMRELATNRGDKTRRSKKDRVSMKSTFRELCNVVEVCAPIALHSDPNSMAQHSTGQGRAGQDRTGQYQQRPRQAQPRTVRTKTSALQVASC